MLLMAKTWQTKTPKLTRFVKLENISAYGEAA